MAVARALERVRLAPSMFWRTASLLWQPSAVEEGLGFWPSGRLGSSGGFVSAFSCGFGGSPRTGRSLRPGGRCRHVVRCELGPSTRRPIVRRGLPQFDVQLEVTVSSAAAGVRRLSSGRSGLTSPCDWWLTAGLRPSR